MGPVRARRMQAVAVLLIALCAASVFAAEGEQGEGGIAWIEGPAVVDLGDDLAQVEMGETYLFAGPDDTRLIMEYFGNPPTNAEVGMIVPASEEEDWFLVFEYFDVGHIKDDDKDEIDAAAILESYRKGTEQANEQRAELGASPIHVTGWYEEPFYDDTTHNLTWAMLLEDDEKVQVVNYNIRLLGREGYMSAVLVTDPDSLDSLKPEMEGLIAGFSYKQGSRYAEYVKGDKLAKMGLAALIAGGAGAAAVKLGLFQVLAKFWKAIVVGIAAFFTAIWKIIKGVFRSEEKLPMGQPPRTGDQGDRQE